jgi:hypothetical protein
MNLIYLEIFLESLIENLPQFFWAVLVFLLGLLVSKWIADWVIRFLNKTRLNQALKRLGWEESFAKMDIHFDGPQFFGKIARFFIILLFLMASAEIIGLPQFSQFLGDVLGYFPNIFIASLIFIVAVFLADFSQKIMVAVLEEEKITYSKFLGRAIRWIIWSLATLAILYQLQIAPTLILAIFIGFVAMVVLAIGIAFGLGGREIAAKIIKELEEKIR